MSPDAAERARQEAEIARVPIGSTVKARGCPGLGVGVVRELITETRFTDGRVIPYRGFV